MAGKSEVLDEFEETALLGACKVREFLMTTDAEGAKESRDKAKVGAMAMGAYARLRATFANEKHLALQLKRTVQSNG